MAWNFVAHCVTASVPFCRNNPELHQGMLVWCNVSNRRGDQELQIRQSQGRFKAIVSTTLPFRRYLRRGRQPLAIDPGPLYCELHRSRISAWRKHGPQGRSTRLDFLEEQRERARKAVRAGTGKVL